METSFWFILDIDHVCSGPRRGAWRGLLTGHPASVLDKAGLNWPEVEHNNDDSAGLDEWERGWGKWGGGGKGGKAGVRHYTEEKDGGRLPR